MRFNLKKIGAWRSLVARLPWAQEVPGSNPGAPTSVPIRVQDELTKTTSRSSTAPRLASAQAINSSRSARCRHTVRRRDYSEGGVLAGATRRALARPLAVLLGALVCFEGFAHFLAPETEARRVPGTLPIRGSLATMSSQARSAASSKF